MKKILLISTIYPIPSKDNKGTAVCHFFAREWLKMGYEVRVVHIQAVYPEILYRLARLARSRIASLTGAVVYTEAQKEIVRYEMDEVPVMRVPVFKPIPHGAFQAKSLRNALDAICADLAAAGFVPDLAVGHFPNPQIGILNALKQRFAGLSTCCVLHLESELGQIASVYRKNFKELMAGIDVWGFRYKHLLTLFTDRFGAPEKSFICYSGVPDGYIATENNRTYGQPLREFVFVGEMIARKHPAKVLEALEEAYPSRDYHLTYIGDGQQLEIIREQARTAGASDRVDFLGKIPRDAIKSRYDAADCMVMISEGEAYGLVYLEAMARGCIVIASRDEGFDGVIIDGVNGFLCRAGDAGELAGIIRKINAMSPEEKRKISRNAWETARGLTDHLAAKRYIEDVLSSL